MVCSATERGNKTASTIAHLLVSPSMTIKISRAPKKNGVLTPEPNSPKMTRWTMRILNDDSNVNVTPQTQCGQLAQRQTGGQIGCRHKRLAHGDGARVFRVAAHNTHPKTGGPERRKRRKDSGGIGVGGPAGRWSPPCPRPGAGWPAGPPPPR